jgi:hypothetical protein
MLFYERRSARTLHRADVPPAASCRTGVLQPGSTQRKNSGACTLQSVPPMVRMRLQPVAAQKRGTASGRGSCLLQCRERGVLVRTPSQPATAQRRLSGRAGGGPSVETASASTAKSVGGGGSARTRSGTGSTRTWPEGGPPTWAEGVFVTSIGRGTLDGGGVPVCSVHRVAPGGRMPLQLSSAQRTVPSEGCAAQRVTPPLLARKV